MTGVADTVDRLVDRAAVGLVLGALDQCAVGVGRRHRTAQGIGVLVAGRGDGVARPVVVDRGDQAAGEVDVLVRGLAAGRADLGAEQILPRLAVLEDVSGAVVLQSFRAAAVRVVAVALLAHDPAQAVAVVETVLLTVLVGQVALHVVVQAHHRGADAVLDVGQAVVGVVQVGVFAHAGVGHGADIVQAVVSVVDPMLAAAERGRTGPDQAIQGVVLKVTVVVQTLDSVVDPGRVAAGIVDVREPEDVPVLGGLRQLTPEGKAGISFRSCSKEPLASSVLPDKTESYGSLRLGCPDWKYTPRKSAEFTE